MGYAVFSARKVHLTHRVNFLNNELLKLTQQRNELSIYGNSLGDSYLDFEEMAGMPLALRPFALQYATQGHFDALMGAGQDTDMLMAQYMASPNGAQLTPEQQYNIQNSLFQKAFKQRLNEAQKAEMARIQQIDNEIDMKMKKIDTQLTAASKELEKVEEAEKNAIERSTPKYA